MHDRVNDQPEALFRAMSDRTRWRALAVLRRHELAVSELVEVLDQPQSTVSRHLRVLREANLLRDRRDGRTVLYSLPPSGTEGAESELSNQLLGWIADQPLSPSTEARLDAVIRRRSDMSRRFFDRTGRHWDALREESFGSSFHLEAFVALLPPEWVVADVGTGTGFLLPPLAVHFDRVIAVDAVDAMLDVAGNRTEFHRLDNVELCRGDVSRLPISDASVNLATAFLMLHHVPVPREALSELYRILQRDGRVLIVEQAAHRCDAFHERMQDRWAGFDAADLGGWLRSVGFKDVRSNPLITAERALDAPDLFVMTGRKET